jgi:RNA polymerase sigma factor (sigma-70 family)
LTPQAAFESLYRRDARAVLGFALRRTERPDDAAEALSDVMLTAWRRWDDVPSDPHEARLWLYAVAHRVLANQRRSASRRSSLGEKLQRELTQLASRDIEGSVATRDTVMRALARLPTHEREVLVLSAWEGLQPMEIASVLRLNDATARSRLHRARMRLRSELEREER